MSEPSEVPCRDPGFSSPAGPRGRSGCLAQGGAGYLVGVARGLHALLLAVALLCLGGGTRREPPMVLFRASSLC